MSGLTRAVFFEMLNVHLIYIGKFLLKEKELHSIEVNCRYKQAHTLILRVYTP